MSFASRSIAALCLAGGACWALLAGCNPSIFDSESTVVRRVDNENPPAKSPPARQTTAAPQKTASVKIDQFAFEPASLSIAPGTTVEWINHDDVPHTVVDVHGAFKSQALDTDDVFRHTFQEPGDSHYFCSVHPHMVGEVHVKN
jgi:plastocyanin